MPASDPLCAVIAERYELIRELGRGGMSTVYLAEDRQLGQKCALKVLHHGAGANRELLRAEFAAMLRMRHPAIVEVFDFGVSGDGSAYFTMEAVQGTDFGVFAAAAMSEIGVASRFCEGPLGSIMADLLGALECIHRQGFLHADLKPSNVLVTTSGNGITTRPRAKLVDFGLLTSPRRFPPGEARGTLRYMAPEMLASEFVDQRADLFSLGVILFEALSGRHPFRGEDLAEMSATGAERPAAPKELPETVPAALGAIVRRLLEPVVALRYLSAAEALEDLVACGAGVSPETANEVYQDSDASWPLRATRFCGREWELGQIQHAIGKATARAGAVIVVHGQSGAGKSRLIAELKHRLELTEAEVVELPRHLSRSIGTQGDAANLRSAEPGAEPLEATGSSDLLEAEAAAMAPAAPAGPSNANAASITIARHRAQAVLAAAILPKRAAVTLLLDDVDLLTADDLETLRYLTSLAVCEGHSLVLASRVMPQGAVESAEETVPAGVSSFLEYALSLDTALALPLEGLTPAEVDRYLAVTLGHVNAPEQLAHLVHGRTQGIPALIEELLDSARRLGAVRRRGGRWEWDPDRPALAELVLPETALDMLRLRLRRLPPGELQILGRITVLGTDFDRGAAHALSGVEPATTEEAIRRAAAFGLVLPADEKAEAGGEMRFASPEVASLLGESLLPAERSLAHQRALEWIASQPQLQDSQWRCARHLYELGRVVEAVSAGLAAAAYSEASGAPREAVKRYQWAEEAAREGGLELGDGPRNIRERLARVAMACGDFETAERAGREALAALPRADVDRREEMHGLLAQALQCQGRARDALAEVEQGLAIAGAETRGRLELLIRSGRLAWSMGNTDDAVVTLRAALAMAERRHSARHQALARISMGDALAQAGRSGEARDCFAAALGVAELVRAPDLRAAAELGLGNCAIDTGCPADARHHYTAALEAAGLSGDDALIARCRNSLGRTLAVFGDWPGAREQWLEVGRLTTLLGNDQQSVYVLHNLASLDKLSGAFDTARRQCRRALEIARRAGLEVLLPHLEENLADIELAAGDAARGVPLMQACLTRAVAACEWDRAMAALRALIDCGVRVGSRAELAELHNRAESIIAKHSGADFSELPELLRALSEADAILGAPESALARIEQLRSPQPSGVADPLVLARLDAAEARARAGLGQFEAALERIQAAVSSFASLGARPDLARAQKLLAELDAARDSRRQRGRHLDILLSVAQDVGALQDLDTLLDRIMDKVFAVTGAQRGFLLLFREDGSLECRVGRNLEERLPNLNEIRFSRSLVTEVASSMRPVSYTNILEHEAFATQESVIALGLRSAMCVPMTTKGKKIGVIYVDSQRVANRFSKEDLELLAALGLQAAIAIENARLYADQERKTELLGYLAHELRTPMSSILLYAHLVRREAGDNTIVDGYLNKIDEQVNRSDGLIRHILDLARAEAGKLPLVMGKVDIAVVIDAVMDSVRGLAEAKDIAVAVDIPREVPALRGDADRLVQVLTNLMVNAIKFAPRGSEVAIMARSEHRHAGSAGRERSIADLLMEGVAAQPQHFVRVSVSDSGPGIPVEQQELIFRKFEKGRQSKELAREGAGLGLSIAKEIVRLHSGRIGVTSAPGAGTTFFFTVPASE
ncbi:MAG: protein kinase [Candidatus Schekmanbacteria bacterium]|nr:protein kinase [Candidatus Schekmanbacteria bacterium]